MIWPHTVKKALAVLANAFGITTTGKTPAQLAAEIAAEAAALPETTSADATKVLTVDDTGAKKFLPPVPPQVEQTIYNVENTYVTNELVVYDGRTYRAKKDNPTGTPDSSVDWELVVTDSYSSYVGVIAGSTDYKAGQLVSDKTLTDATTRTYRCLLSFTTAGSPTAPASDTTHWQLVDEPPVRHARVVGRTHAVAIPIASKPTASDEYRFTAHRALTLLAVANLPTGEAHAGRFKTAATGASTFNLHKATAAAPQTLGSSVGTAVVSASGRAVAFTIAADVSLAQADSLVLVAPASQDATLADGCITLVLQEA
jgi:hypothetical protein